MRRAFVRTTLAASVAAAAVVSVAPDVRPADAFDGEMVWIAGAGDGEGAQATDVEFRTPVDVAIDSDGSVLVAERGVQRIRRISTDGTLATVVAANGGTGDADGGPAVSATLTLTQGVAADASSIYIADDQIIRRIDKASGTIGVFAGDGKRQYTGDGVATAKSIGTPVGMAADGSGGLLVAESWNSIVRRVSGGIITTVAGTTATAVAGDGGPATSAYLNQPYDVAVDPNGNMYIADTENHRVRRVDTGGTISTIAGTGSAGYSGDGGSATAAALSRPTSVAVAADGAIYISDTGNNAIRRVDAAGVITTVAGGLARGFSGDGGPATAAQLKTPRGIAVDLLGRIVVADADNNRIRRFVPGGVIVTVAGNGRRDFGVTNGAAREAAIGGGAVIAVDSDGSVLIGDGDMIRRLDGNGGIRRIAGTGGSASSGDGGAAELAEFSPWGIAVDVSGNRYITDIDHDVIRRIDPTGVITTVAGTGVRGHGGDGGPAVLATLDGPTGIAVDRLGNVYFGEGSRVRRIDPAGTITTVAGSDDGSSDGDGGPATAAHFVFALDVAVDAVGNIYIADYGGSGVRKIDRAGTISTVAEGNEITAVAVDAAGNLFYTDGNLHELDTAGRQRTLTSAGDRRELTTGGSPANAVAAGDLYDVAIDRNGDVFVLGTYLVADIGFTWESWVYRIEHAAAADLRTYVPTTPVPIRIVDTRYGIGAPDARVGSDHDLTVPVAGRFGIAENAIAVVVNVTAVNSAADGYVTVFPCGNSPTPSTSTLNQVADRIVANATITRIGAAGAICVRSSVSTDVVVDLQGWYPAQTDYKPVNPTRLGDSRLGQGFSAHLVPGRVASLEVAGRSGVADDASAAAINATATNSVREGFVTAFPCGVDPPLASNVNTWPGHAIANFSVTAIGRNRSICFVSSVETDLVVDLQGWYPLSTTYRSMAPKRLAGTRMDSGPLAQFEERAVRVTGTAGVPADATSVVVTVTAVDATGDAFVTVHPCGQPRPLESNNNTSPDRIVASLAVVPVGTNGTVCVTGNTALHIVIDIEGWHRETR